MVSSFDPTDRLGADPHDIVEDEDCPLGRRWAPRTLWELRDGPRTFRALRDACEGVSPSVLNARPKELRESGLLELREGEGYALTPRAEELGALLLPLDAWAKSWARRR